jgi:secernin
MCDTLVATSTATKDAVAIFAKNSDREPNEAQFLLSLPAADYRPGSTLRCTYIEIFQAKHTHAVLLSKPFWMWGAEMGANEHGVAIGNEAVFSKIPANRSPALIGMDLVRLGLERGQSARSAIDLMTQLLERYGQGGNCGFKQKTYYQNSFIVADPKDAWLLETVNKRWAAKQLDGVYTISNGLTLGQDWDLSTGDLESYALQKGWSKKKSDFNFAAAYSDFLFTKFSDCRARRNRTQRLLMQAGKNIDVPKAISVLRDHGDAPAPAWGPDKGFVGCSVCMHAGFGPVRISQTTGSMASWLHPDRAVHFFTGTAAPCTGIFKPVWTDVPIPGTGPQPAGVYDDVSLFWRHEKLHRATLTDYAHRLSLYQSDRDALEEKFIQKALAQAFDEPGHRKKFSKECFESADALEKIWVDRIRGAWVQKQQSRLYVGAWKKFNRQAQMPDPVK